MDITWISHGFYMDFQWILHWNIWIYLQWKAQNDARNHHRFFPLPLGPSLNEVWTPCSCWKLQVPDWACRPCSAWKWLSTCTPLATSRTLLKCIQLCATEIAHMWIHWFIGAIHVNPVVNCSCVDKALLSLWGTREQRLLGILAFPVNSAGCTV